MSPRYAMIVARAGPERSSIVRRFAQRSGLRQRYATDALAVLGNAALTCLPAAAGGCVLGWLFHRHGPARQLTELSETEGGSIARTLGDELLRSYWGGYVAALVEADGVKVLRDPSGTFPCYHAPGPGFAVMASDAAILAACGMTRGVNLEEVGRELYRAFVPRPSTALHGVEEMLPGFAMAVGGSLPGRQPWWSPWDHVEDRGDASDAAAERLARTVRHCVAAWGSTTRRSLLSVSGGLDSSIIAACLADADSETVCLTMFTDDPAGDERPFARALCDHLALRLIERPYRLEDIDIAEPLASHLPRPRDRTQANAYERVNLEVAAEIDADAFVTGNGGDHVLGYSQSAAPIADRYLVQGIGPGLLGSLRDVCQQTGCSLIDALRHAIRLAHRPPSSGVRPNPRFLHPEFLATCGPDEVQHPWLDAPPGALPGKAAHISNILRVQPTIEAGRGLHAPVLTPFLSQPIVEACLAIPSWNWRTGGRDRALARQAFADRLPPVVRNRRVKGTPGRFAARLLDHFRSPIRERVLGGHLAANRIIDAVAIEQVLKGERPVPDLERVRILEIVNAEAWIDHWRGRPELAEPGPRQVRAAGPGRPPASAGPIR